MLRSLVLALLVLSACGCAGSSDGPASVATTAREPEPQPEPEFERVPRSRPPNVVVVLADDLGWAELGSYGQRLIRTPNLDRMAAEGMRFTQHYSGSAVCAPARCVLMTGLHTGHAFIRDNGEVKPEGQRPIPADTRTLAELAKDAGYATGIFGKWGLGGPDTEGVPNRQGFDEWYGYLCQRQAHNFYPAYLWHNEVREELAGNDRGLTGAQYSHDLIADAALEFVREHADEPFFLYVPFTIPHLALQVPEDSLAEYRGRWEDPPYEGGKGYLPHPAPRAAYAAMVTRMDRDVGRLLDLLGELGIAEDTAVFFASDNGPTYDRIGGSDSDFFHSAGPFRGLKGSLYEGGIRVPLIVRWPGQIEPGRVSDHLSAFWDVMPTVAELIGAPPPAGVDGLSFAPTLLGEPERQEQHDYLYWEFRAYGGQQAVRAGDWKGVRQRMKSGNRAIELYDLGRDVAESTDLAPLHPDVVERMRALMDGEARVESEEFPLRWQQAK
jgi:arylsulfatase